MSEALVGNFANYVTTNRFYVEIDGTIVARFSECSGIYVQIKKDVYFEGGVNDQQRIFLGHAEFADITFKRGITDDPAFIHWLGTTFDEAFRKSRRDVNLLLYNQAGEIMLSWTFIGSVPRVLKTSTMQADGMSVAIEELTVAIEGLKIDRSTGGGLSELRKNDGYIGYSKWKLEPSK